MTRRKFAKAVSVGAAAAVVAPALRAQAPPPVKALVFDTFGTVVDWRGSIIAEGMAWSKSKGVTVDWPRFADRWRDGYHPAMEKVRKGQLPWTKLDDLHRMIFDELVTEFGITGLKRSGEGSVESRLAPPQTMARFRRRVSQAEKEVSHFAAFKRQRVAAD